MAWVGDGEVVPPGVAVLKSLLMDHPHLVGEGLVGEVVDHPPIVNPPKDGESRKILSYHFDRGLCGRSGAIGPTGFRSFTLSNII